MAPNVKQIAFLTESLADLNLVQSKYLPLTDPSSEAELQSTQQQQQVQTQEPSFSYWDFPADEEIVQEETQYNLFSADRIEQNLIQESQQQRSASDVVVIVADHADTAENDLYWSEQGSNCDEDQTATTTNKPQHDNYWYFPADPQQAQVQAILLEEAARNLVSGANIEKNLVQSRLPSDSTPPQMQNPANDSYWQMYVDKELLEETYSNLYWSWQTDDIIRDSPVVSNKKSDLIHWIVQSEAARHILSTQRMEENLMKQQKISLSNSCCSQTLASSDDYWNSKEPSDYWDWSAKPATAAVTCGYWEGM